MSLRIRGSEVTVRIAVDGAVLQGSMIKLQEFTATPRTDLMEEDYLGELETDLDIQHHGWDLSFTVHQQDETTLQLFETIIDRERAQQRHPDITMTVIYRFREELANNRVEVYHDVFLKITEQGFSGRKEYVSVGFEGKSKRRSLINA